jgi:hypothetical protein
MAVNFKKKLRCSFCRKHASEVSKLLGGRRVHIWEATLSTFTGRNAMTDAQLLDSLEPAVAAVEATRSVLQMQTDELRKRGINW